MTEKLISTAYNYLLKIVRFLLVVATVALVVVVFANVICRYFLDASLAWSGEAARFLFIWTSLLGIVLANESHEHMKFDLLVKRVSEKAAQVISIVAYLVIIAVLILILRGGITIVINNLTWMTPALDISYGFVYSIVPICASILILQTVARIYQSIKILFGLSKKQ